MTKATMIVVVSLAAHLAAAPGTAFGQGAQAMTIVGPIDGDCAVKIANVPTGTDIHELALFLDDRLLTARPARRNRTTVTLKLLDPLHEGSAVAVAVGRAGTRTDPVFVQQALQQEQPPPTTCAETLLADDRQVFEASAYIGESFDNFSPFERSQYKEPPSQPGVYSRFLAGVESQYRLVGQRGHTFQVWLSEFTLHGVRSADIDCSPTGTPSSPLCEGIRGNNQNGIYLAVLEHQTSLEAHFTTRIEFLTLQKTSETPIKVFADARFGFVDLSGAPKVFNANVLGVGIVSPAGVFKNSYAQVGWGQSEQFQSRPGWNRMKVTGSLVFDLVPGFKDRLEFWKRLAGSPRMFVLINVDRNPGGPGPDSVNTYIGIDIDLRRMFFGL
jgi:hypothetical protein